MSSKLKQDRVLSGVIKTSVVIALFMAALSFAPALSCLTTPPGPDSVEEGMEQKLPKRTFGQCVELAPPSHQRLPVGIGLMALIVAAGAGVGRRGLKGTSADKREQEMATVEMKRKTMRIESVQQFDRDLRGHGQLNVDAIDVSQELDLQATPVQTANETQSHAGSPTLMDMVAIQIDTIKEREERSRVERVTIEGFYCPRRLLGKPIIYVDPRHEASSDRVTGEDSGSLELPFKTISAALLMAEEVVSKTNIPVQVRVMPGVYQEALKIPSKVSVLNHRMPGDGGLEEHLAWLTRQQEVDHPERVTIFAPPSARIAVFFEVGTRQGLYGCHVISRDGISQVGLGNERSTELMVRTCVFSGFKLGGVQLNKAGGETQGLEVKLEGCHFNENEALKGGAVAIRESFVVVHHCVFERNVASSGGAIFASEPRGTLTITYSKFYKNKAKADEVIESHAEEVPLKSWFECSGRGGAIGVERGTIKLAMCELRTNGASNAGGALSLVSSRALLQGGAGQQELVMRGNRARQGGAIFMVGSRKAPSTLKGTQLLFEQNLGQSLGGAIGLVGTSVIQLAQSRFMGNIAQGPDSLGGGVGCLLGAEFLGDEVTFQANKAQGAGGALAARNGSVRLKSCVLQDNYCEEGRGAGLYLESLAGARLDKLLEHGELKVPFVLKLKDVEFLGNIAAKAPSALFVGNMVKVSTLPIDMELAGAIQARGNSVTGQANSEAVAVVWAGERRLGQGQLDAQRIMLG